MSIVTIAGDFSVNGNPSIGMDCDTEHKIIFNEASGLVAVIATAPNGKLTKGVAVATEGVLNSLLSLGDKARRDETIRMPQAF